MNWSLEKYWSFVQKYRVEYILSFELSTLFSLKNLYQNIPESSFSLTKSHSKLWFVVLSRIHCKVQNVLQKCKWKQVKDVRKQLGLKGLWLLAVLFCSALLLCALRIVTPTFLSLASMESHQLLWSIIKVEQSETLRTKSRSQKSAKDCKDWGIQRTTEHRVAITVRTPNLT